VAAHLATPLTTVRMPNFRMGQQAVRMLLRAAEGGPVSDLMIEDPPELVVRASTAPPS
jgi:DNA-binding LacI/PurR family transcriptional regulator